MKKRVLSFMISLILILALIPMTAFAKESGSKSVTSPAGYTISASCDKHGSISMEKSGEKVKINVSPEEGYAVDYCSAKTVIPEGAEDVESVRIKVTKDGNTYTLKLADVDAEGFDVSVYAGFVADSDAEEAVDTEEAVSTDTTEDAAVEETVVEETVSQDPEVEETQPEISEDVDVDADEDAVVVEDETADPDAEADDEVLEDEEDLELEIMTVEEASEDAADASDELELAATATITSTDLSWVKDSGKTLVVNGSGKSSAFKNVKVDGSTVDASNYTKSGTNTTKVTFTAAYMNSLSTGVHTVAFGYSGGDTPAVNMLIKQSPASTITNVETTPTSGSGNLITPGNNSTAPTTGTNGSGTTYVNRVQTGDTAQMGVWITLIIVAAFAIASVPSAADKKLY